MESHTSIKITGKDEVGVSQEVSVRDCEDNLNWVVIEASMNDCPVSISIPKTFIPSLINALTKIQSS
jgi:hypothetical protein